MPLLASESMCGVLMSPPKQPISEYPHVIGDDEQDVRFWVRCEGLAGQEKPEKGDVKRKDNFFDRESKVKLHFSLAKCDL